MKVFDDSLSNNIMLQCHTGNDKKTMKNISAITVMIIYA